jgi:uncharacterized membrane-anchored protein
MPRFTWLQAVGLVVVGVAVLAVYFYIRRKGE